MTKWGPVFLGFILAVIVKSFFAHYEFIGLLLVGFIVGYLCRDGAISGMWNAAVAGAFRNHSICNIICYNCYLWRSSIWNLRRFSWIYSIRNYNSLYSFRIFNILCNSHGYCWRCWRINFF